MDIRPGDLLLPNAPLAKVLEADQLYVMVYVPQTEIGRVHIGDKAEVTVDSFPHRTFPARVEQIRQQAEFLPRNVQTRIFAWDSRSPALFTEPSNAGQGMPRLPTDN